MHALHQACTFPFSQECVKKQLICCCFKSYCWLFMCTLWHTINIYTHTYTNTHIFLRLNAATNEWASDFKRKIHFVILRALVSNGLYVYVCVSVSVLLVVLPGLVFILLLFLPLIFRFCGLNSHIHCNFAGVFVVVRFLIFSAKSYTSAMNYDFKFILVQVRRCCCFFVHASNCKQQTVSIVIDNNKRCWTQMITSRT